MAFASYMHMRRIAFLLTLALPIEGATVVTLQRNGAPVAEGEVCRFRAGDAENPFRRWLASADLQCVAAGAAMEFPSGLWNVFGRIEGKALSAPILISGAAAPDTLSLQLETAATLTPILPAGQRGLVYAPRLGSAVPIADGTQRVTVPAGQELWLFVIEKSGAISAVLPIAAITPGSERAVDARTGGLPSSVLGWVRVPEADRAALSQAQDVSSPLVRMIGAGPARDSDRLPPPALLHGSFVLVRGVSAGEAELRVEGQGWLPHARRVTIADRKFTVVEEPLLARGAAALNVTWNSGEDLSELDAALGSCGSLDEGTQVVITVSACAGPQHPGEPVDPASCKAIRQETFLPQVPSGSFSVDDLAAGHYRAEFRFGKLPPIGEMVEAEPFQRTRAAVFAYYTAFSGSLTLDGEPLGKDARLEIAGGGVGFASRESGRYYAVIPDMTGEGLPEDSQIDIATCEEEQGVRAFVLTDRPLRSGAHYDIDIPDNVITIRVTDTFTRMALHAATLQYSILSDRSARPVVTQELKSEEGASAFVLGAVPVRRQILLSVRHPGYQEYRVPPFTMGTNEEKTIDAQLVPLRGSSGRIVSSLPFESGLVLWMSAIGTETERADLAPDGTFVYSNKHAPDETMAVVSLSHPLWVLRAPAAANRQELVAHFPDGAPRRAIDVLLRAPDRRADTFIGVVIGGVLVPQAALRVHQTLRELPYVVRTDRLLHIRDLSDTGPIDVLLGPTVNDVPSRGRSFDPLLLPRSDETPRQRLAPGMTQVVFEE
jgi:hypothetical protein